MVDLFYSCKAVKLNIQIQEVGCDLPLTPSNDTEYQLWLRNDLYTSKHTQWYYFRVRNTRPAVKYKFTIMNLFKVRAEWNSYQLLVFYLPCHKH